jgi:hypothetical protein
MVFWSAGIADGCRFVIGVWRPGGESNAYEGWAFSFFA